MTSRTETKLQLFMRTFAVKVFPVTWNLIFRSLDNVTLLRQNMFHVRLFDPIDGTFFKLLLGGLPWCNFLLIIWLNLLSESFDFSWLDFKQVIVVFVSDVRSWVDSVRLFGRVRSDRLNELFLVDVTGLNCRRFRLLRLGAFALFGRWWFFDFCRYFLRCYSCDLTRIPSFWRIRLFSQIFHLLMLHDIVHNNQIFFILVFL